MNLHNVSLELQNRARSYLVFIQYQKRFKMQEPIMDKISIKLKKDIMYTGYIDKIKTLF